MLSRCNVAIIGTPRSASSFLAKFLVSQGWTTPRFGDAPEMSASNFNPEGYFENTFLNLLDDQIIRAHFGLQHSFLFPPAFPKSEDAGIDANFTFDIDETSLDIPLDYESNLEFYTGDNWDVWGLTRMRVGGKWYKAYSNRNISTSEGLNKAILMFNEYLKRNSSLVLKDSRLTFTLNFFRGGIDKVIILRRKEDGLVSSIKRHYGKNIFTNFPVNGYPWVSNHFNYKIGVMDYFEFDSRYDAFCSFATQHFQTLYINQEDIKEKEVQNSIIEFLDS